MNELVVRLRTSRPHDALDQEAADEIERLQQGFDVMTKLAEKASIRRDQLQDELNAIKGRNA